MRSVVGAGWLNVDQALSPIRILSSRGLQQSVRGGGGGCGWGGGGGGGEGSAPRLHDSSEYALSTTVASMCALV